MSKVLGSKFRNNKIISQKFGDLIKIHYFRPTILKANHNKDYSVVKTSGKPLRHIVGGIFLSLYQNKVYNIRK